MITPSFLVAGDEIYITATARKVEKAEIEPAITHLQQAGFKVTLSEALFDSHFQFGGTDKVRAQELQKALDNPAIKAIICARGGYGTVRIVDQLDFSLFKQHPKWLCGFSDITVLHSHLHTLGFASFHGPLAVNMHNQTDASFFISEDSRTRMIQMLKGQEAGFQWEAHPLNKAGEAEGMMVGGNLSVLYSISGSVSDVNMDGKILFLEDIDEYLYHLDRMMYWLKRSGKLEKLAGLVVGNFDQMKNLNGQNPFGSGAYKIISSAVEDYSFPVAYNFPAGHGKENHSLYMGVNVQLQVSDNKSTIGYPQF
jgi:muramoyltetrapeptide carboxypeptidase